MRLLALLLLVACPATSPDLNDDDDVTTDDDDATDAPADPLDLAELAEVDEVERTILDLQELGTRYTFSDGAEEAKQYLVGRLADLGFVAELDPFTVGNTETSNVIARMEGTENPDTVWIYSAHYDSTSTEPDTWAPGADDNATGVAGVLEAARILAPLELGDSVWFVFTAAEEQGSLGSEHLVSWLPTEGVSVAGVIAPDMIGYWPLGDDDLLDILGDDESEHLVEAMSAVCDDLGLAHKTWIDHGYCYGDDHTNFQEAGFPAITPMDCVEAHNLPASGEATPHYHRTSDTIDTVHLPFTTRVIGATVATLAELAGLL